MDAALQLLSDSQLPTGGFVSWDTENCESAAQVLVALTSLGIDPLTDSRFLKDGATVLDALCAFAVEGGGFRTSPSRPPRTIWPRSRASTRWPPTTASPGASPACST